MKSRPFVGVAMPAKSPESRFGGFLEHLELPQEWRAFGAAKGEVRHFLAKRPVEMAHCPRPEAELAHYLARFWRTTPRAAARRDGGGGDVSTLAKRATPRQAVVMRMIEGACRNTMHVHPGRVLDERLARSIAKRAAGTLTAQWSGTVLAASAVREASVIPRVTDAACSCQVQHASKRGAAQCRSRTPLRRLHRALGKMAQQAKREGQDERHAALVDVLRLLAVEAAGVTP